MVDPHELSNSSNIFALRGCVALLFPLGKKKKRKRNSENCCVLTCHENDKANDWRMAVTPLHVLKLQKEKRRCCCLKPAVWILNVSGLDCSKSEETTSRILVPSFLLACCGL